MTALSWVSHLSDDPGLCGEKRFYLCWHPRLSDCEHSFVTITSRGYRFKPQGQGENCMRIVTTVWGRRLVRKAMWNYLIHELPRISQTTNTSCIFLSFLFSQKLITTPILSHIWDTKLTLICYNLEKQGTYRQQSDMLWLGETGDMQLTIIYALTCGDRGHAANNHICSDLGEQAVAVS